MLEIKNSVAVGWPLVE